MTYSLQPQPTIVRPRQGKAIPPQLKPLVRAYILGYASTVAPRLIALVVQHIIRATKKRDKQQHPPRRGGQSSLDTVAAAQPASFVASLLRILRRGLEFRGFPFFCGLLVGLSTLLEIPLSGLISRVAAQISQSSRRRSSRFLATFFAAWTSLSLLQSKHDGFTDTVPVKGGAQPPSFGHQTVTRHGGRTLDLTLFALSRAIDATVGALWARRRSKLAELDAVISWLADPLVFATSSGIIMWNFFYSPDRLPQGYQTWIGTAAAVDSRLVEALRRCRTGELQYGEDTGQASLLQSMCADFKFPLDWGDPARSVPYPCELVHMGSGPSCEYHAVSRFYRSFRWAIATYLPLNLLLAARHPRFRSFKAALISGCKSSAFLAAFVSLFYYGVCLSRTRLGPHLIGKDKTSCNKIDGGICVGVGCCLCGLSIFLEAPGRRGDLGLFVAPRAMATFLPRRYPFEKQPLERLVFSLSTAVVFTFALENPQRVRGIIGRLLHSVLVP